MRHATMKRGRNTGHFLRLLVLFLFGSSNAFQNTGRFFLGMKNPPVAQSTISPLWDHGQALRFREMKLISTSGQKKDEEYNTGNTLRDRLRKATGLSLTAFRAAWHAATGISLTAIYATTLAASGLWIRKLTSALLYVFPAWVSEAHKYNIRFPLCRACLLISFSEVPLFSATVSDSLLSPYVRYSWFDGTHAEASQGEAYSSQGGLEGSS